MASSSTCLGGVRDACARTRASWLTRPFLASHRHFEATGGPSAVPHLFLGDYVDRGKHSLETMCLLLALKAWLSFWREIGRRRG